MGKIKEALQVMAGAHPEIAYRSGSLTIYRDGTAEGFEMRGFKRIPLERSPLVSVEHVSTVANKSTAGRLFAASLTGGTNILLSSGRTGSQTVVVGTEAWVTKVPFTQKGDPAALIAAGKTVILDRQVNR